MQNTKNLSPVLHPAIDRLSKGRNYIVFHTLSSDSIKQTFKFSIEWRITIIIVIIAILTKAIYIAQYIMGKLLQ